MFVPPFVPALTFESALSLVPADAPSGGGVVPVLFVSEKFCFRCERFLPSGLFSPDRRNACGLTAYCVRCERVRKRGMRSSAEAGWRRGYWERCRLYGIAPVVEPFTRADMVVRDGECCAACGVEGSRLEIDHVVPVAAGGSHTLANVRLLCRRCNASKAVNGDAALIAAYREKVSA